MFIPVWVWSLRSHSSAKAADAIIELATDIDRIKSRIQPSICLNERTIPAMPAAGKSRREGTMRPHADKSQIKPPHQACPRLTGNDSSSKSLSHELGALFWRAFSFGPLMGPSDGLVT
ncbi:hypothetical protein GCM10010837_05110 [Aminobacter niigataensis]